jgi:hypothetical protein
MPEKNTTFSKFSSVYLSVLIAIGIGIRMPLMSIPLDGDEGTNYTYFADLLWSELFTKYLDPQQHTLYIAVAYVFRVIFGESEFIFRLPALLTSVLSVFLIYRVSLKITDSPFISFFSATLINFSLITYHYSVRGRGYAITLFLSLLLIYAVIKIFESKKTTLWHFIFVFGGLFLVVALPSNAFFLGAVSMFFLTLKYKNETLKNLFLSKYFYRETSFIILTAILAFSYFFIIWSDLVKGFSIAANYAITVGENIKWSFPRLIETWSQLLQPWGLWILGIFVFGFIRIRKNKYFAPIVTFMLFILILQGVSNIIPPARSIIFLLPIVFIVTAYGIRDVLDFFSNRFSVDNKQLVLTVVFLATLTPSYFDLNDFYKERVRKAKSTTIADSKEALNYLQNEIPNNSLIVLPKVDRALIYYLVKETTKRNVEVIKKRNLENIFFIGPGAFNFLSFGAPMENPENEWFNNSDSSKNIFGKIKQIGNLSVWKFNGRITNLSSRPDFENILMKSAENSHFKIGPNYNQRVEGESSLLAYNKKSNLISLKANSLRFNFSSHPVAIVLKLLLRKHNNISKIDLMDEDTNTFPFWYSLNMLQGGFKLDPNKKILPFERFPLEWLHKYAWKQKSNEPKENWIIDLKLTPLKKKSNLKIMFSIFPNETIWDGLGFYLLSP